MRLSPLASELSHHAVHPAWPRFARTLSDETVLVIHAPAGAGQSWFAQSWFDQAANAPDSVPGHVAHVPAAPDPKDFLALVDAGAEDAGNRTALLVQTNDIPWEALAQVHWRKVDAADMLLEIDELVALLSNLDPGVRSERDGSQAEAEIQQEAERIHRATGGALEASLILARNPDADEHAAEALLPQIIQWVSRLDEGWQMAKVAQLSIVTAQTLSAYFRRVEGDAPPISEMKRTGILRTDRAGEVFMPELFRSALQQLIRRRDPQLAEELNRAALEAVTEVEGLDTAVERASESGSWAGVNDILMDRWFELFTSDARKLRKLAAKVPRFLAEAGLGDGLSVAMRVLAGARDDQMSFLLPTTPPDLHHDGTAQRLRAQTTKAYRRPGPRALTLGLLELSHLRLSGHHGAAAQAAGRLRAALGHAAANRPVPSLLASVVELQAGIALHVGGQFEAAGHAYEAARYWADECGNSFQHANAAGNMALLAAHEGYTERARELLQEHEQYIGDVGWGRRMVARGADLARIIIAQAELDLEKVDAALAILPHWPDVDEFWAVHAFTIASRHVLNGQPQEALEFIRVIRRERRFHAESPLAMGMLGLSEEAALVAAGDNGAIKRQPGSPYLDLIEARRLIRVGQRDAARAVLSRLQPEVLGPRWRSQYRQLQAALDESSLSGHVQRVVTEIHAGRAEMVDLALLQSLGLLAPVEQTVSLAPELKARLDRMPAGILDTGQRPQLTPREEEVLNLLRQGMTRRQIAEQQVRSENTVKTQIRSLYRKLEATSLAEAFKAADRWGF